MVVTAAMMVKVEMVGEKEEGTEKEGNRVEMGMTAGKVVVEMVEIKVGETVMVNMEMEKTVVVVVEKEEEKVMVLPHH